VSFDGDSILWEEKKELFFIAAMSLAYKVVEDNSYTLATWTMISGYAHARIGVAERELLRGINYLVGLDEREYRLMVWEMVKV